ncbi:hypothetical protein ACWF94_08365 [Streptomyces sp. NPDC055078]
MSREFISRTIEQLQEGGRNGLEAIDLGNLARTSLGPSFGAISFIAVFRGAFGIPLNVLQQAQAWNGFDLGGHMIPDEEFSDILSDWLPGTPGQSTCSTSP